ncbi:cytochrome P450 [Nocardia terpenica]|uniref:Cytochrome P450 n=1 Tax=Nocardia terpenica TaxID=455432 RepID=A0A291RR19_9NOCA|nr:cytochrome P450 [Nocardia terpenica]ATL69672.1 hypothetical protein CRH09_29385 [Nocardia terpenica]
MSFPATTHETHLAPGGIPGLGHALRMRRDPLALFESLRPYGDVVRIKLGPQQVYVVTSTAVSTELFVSKYRSFDKGVAVEHFRSVSMMLTARDESSGASMADDRIHDQVMTILLAGSETAATALSWIFLLLDGHPEVATRLLAELHEVLGERPVRAADLPRLTYTTQVVDESLRHSPPIWLITRRATEDVSLGGYLVPRGASVMLSPYLTGHDPTLIEDPDTFDPDRWAADRVTQPLRLAALPFGAGPRKCIGDSFAVVEAIVAIATILPRWRVRRQPGNTITKTAGLTYFPAGLRLTVEARDREPATPNSGSVG